MGLLGRKKSPEHHATVCYMYDRRTGASEAYYIALCGCGWMSDFFTPQGYPDRGAEMLAASAALAHDPLADTTVGFPLDEPKR